MAGPYYQSDVSAQAPSKGSVTLPEVANDGGATGNAVARTAMSLAEPFLKDKAQSQALEDAGAATIVKNADGTYSRGNLTHGGGLVYSQAYSQALDTRQTNLMSEDYATQLQLAHSRMMDDPTSPGFRDVRAFTAFAQGQAQGMLDAAPPSIKVELDTRFTRDLSEHVRGFAQEVSTTNHRQMADALQVDAGNKLEEIMKLGTVVGGDPAAITQQTNALMGDYLKDVQSLHDIGEISTTAPYIEQGGVKVFDSTLFTKSVQAMQGIASSMGSMSDEELQRLSYWGTYGVDDKNGDGTVGKMKLSDFRDMVPSAEAQHRVGAFASNVLSMRIQAANQKAYLEAQKQPTQLTADQVIANHGNLNFIPATGLTKEQYAGALQQYDANGPIAAQIRTPEGMQRTLGFLAQVGTVPGGGETSNSLRAMALSSDPAAQQSAFDFMWNARNVTTANGTWVGLNWWNTLPDDVKALGQFDAAMRRARFSTTMELKTIFAKTGGKVMSQNDVMGLFGTKQSDYENAANAAVANAFGVKAADLGPSLPLLRRDFDRYMQINANLYATKEQAMQASEAMLSTGWARDGVFLTGVGDKRLAGEGIPLWFMDGVVANTPELRSGNISNAKFQNGQIKIRALSDAPGQGFGSYEFVFFNDHGQQAGRGAIGNMDRIVQLWRNYKGRVARQQQQEALDAMAPPIWKLEHDPKNGGKLRYVDNSAEYQAWAQRQAAKDAARQAGQASDATNSMTTAGQAGGLAD